MRLKARSIEERTEEPYRWHTKKYEPGVTSFDIVFGNHGLPDPFSRAPRGDAFEEPGWTALFHAKQKS